MTTIDVILPAYNSEATIEASVRSVLDQTHRRMTVIAVDDGSTDATRAILERLSGADGRLRVISQQNSGIVGALETALQASSADIVARQDADDISYPERFARQIAYLDAHPDCLAVSCEAAHIDASGHKVGTVARMPPLSTADADWVPAREPYLMHPFLMARRSAIDHVGGYRHFLLCEDVDLYWRLRAIGPLANMPEILGEYRLHASLTGSSIGNARLNAVFTQLAAVSEKRRRARQPDIATDRIHAAQFHGAMSMQSLVDLAARQVGPDETDWFRAACGARLLQLLELRSFSPDRQDCTYLRNVFAYAGRLPPANRREVERLYSVESAKRIRALDIAGAVTLTPPSLMFGSLARAVLKRGC